MTLDRIRDRFVRVAAVVVFAAAASCSKKAPETAPGAPPAVPSSPVPKDAPPSGPAATGGQGSLAGTVTWGGPAPEKKTVEVTKDHASCGQSVPFLGVVVGPGGGLKNALVSIDGLKPAKPYKADAPIVFDQKKCLFENRVTVVPVGSTLDVRNSDDILHNTNFNAVKNKSDNFAIAAGKSKTYEAKEPETIKVTCDIHPWMSAYVVVRDNPYFAVTDENGRFAIPDVPAGRYKVSVWQETVGKGGADAVEIEIKAGSETKQDFVVKPK